MGAKLPEAFTDKLRRMLGNDYEAFLASYDDPRNYGLRVNTLKNRRLRLLADFPFSAGAGSMGAAGFYYKEGERPGKHPFYHAGLYYIQEPSAMSPVELLDVKAGDRVLDLCAAPGGKSTQIAAKLQGQGVLVSNDNHYVRTKALTKNIELAGIRHAVVTNETPDRLAGRFERYFDKILIDAPCSGEGMFRKEEDMIKQWEPQAVERYTAMQRDILREAARMLAPGGRIVYSTCTFSPEENECMVGWFLQGHPSFRAAEVPLPGGASPGRPEWMEVGGCADLPEAIADELTCTVRLWPHLVRGEGHFAAALQHNGAGDDDVQRSKPDIATEQERLERCSQGACKPRSGGTGTVRPTTGRGKDLSPVEEFLLTHTKLAVKGTEAAHGEQVYLMPDGLPDLRGLKVVRPGWHLGVLRNGRFTPSHALAMGLRMEECARTVMLASTEPSAVSYLKGETLEIPEERVVRDPGSCQRLLPGRGGRLSGRLG